MNYLITGALNFLMVTTSFAAAVTNSLPANLIKITEESNPKCVEFVTYQGEMYCSLVAIDKNPVDPNVLSYEKQKVQFDNRPWKAAWSEHTNSITYIEYIPLGDDINNWSELITTQFVPGLKQVTLKEYYKEFFSGIDKAGVTYTTNTLVDQPNLLMFEFQVQKPENLQQDEIQKMVKTDEGIYILHYAFKKEDMGKSNREKWIEYLKNSSLK
jgi:hypothetical protein